MNGQTEMSGRLKEVFVSPAHLCLFCRVAAWTLSTPLLFKALPLPAFMKIVTPRPRTPGSLPENRERFELINTYITVILKRNPDNIGRMCLRRSLVLYRYIRLSGVPAQFCLGVKKDQDGLIGHAWVEIDGNHYLDYQEDKEYFVTFSYPEAIKDRKSRQKAASS
jgi:hypothetical protein